MKKSCSCFLHSPRSHVVDVFWNSEPLSRRQFSHCFWLAQDKASSSVSCSVLQGVAVCSRVLQCVAAYRRQFSHCFWLAFLVFRENAFSYRKCQNVSSKTHPGRRGGPGSRPKKIYGERLGDGVEYHLMSPTPRR